MRTSGLKIDGSFIRRLLDDDRAEAVCRMLIGATRVLDMSIVAEQVETDEQAARLATLGCVVHQGYRYSPSMTLPAATAALTDPAAALDWPDVGNVQKTTR